MKAVIDMRRLEIIKQNIRPTKKAVKIRKDPNYELVKDNEHLTHLYKLSLVLYLINRKRKKYILYTFRNELYINNIKLETYDDIVYFYDKYILIPRHIINIIDGVHNVEFYFNEAIEHNKHIVIYDTYCTSGDYDKDGSCLKVSVTILSKKKIVSVLKKIDELKKAFKNLSKPAKLSI